MNKVAHVCYPGDSKQRTNENASDVVSAATTNANLVLYPSSCATDKTLTRCQCTKERGPESGTWRGNLADGMLWNGRRISRTWRSDASHRIGSIDGRLASCQGNQTSDERRRVEKRIRKI